MSDDSLTAVAQLVYLWRESAALSRRASTFKENRSTRMEHLASSDALLQCAHDLEKALAALPRPQEDRPYVNIFRTPFEAFGHNETCGKWVEGTTRISLEPLRACTCGGVELDADGEPDLTQRIARPPQDEEKG